MKRARWQTRQQPPERWNGPARPVPWWRERTSTRAPHGAAVPLMTTIWQSAPRHQRVAQPQQRLEARGPPTIHPAP